MKASGVRSVKASGVSGGARSDEKGEAQKLAQQCRSRLLLVRDGTMCVCTSQYTGLPPQYTRLERSWDKWDNGTAAMM